MNNYAALLCLMAFINPSIVWAQTTIEIFADEAVTAPSIPEAVITIFDLSRVQAVRASAPHFPPDPVLAESQAKAWLESPAGKSHVANLKAAYAGQVKMMGYGIQKIPAIVFDKGKFVIYGTVDVVRAVEDYDHFMRNYKPTLSTTEQ